MFRQATLLAADGTNAYSDNITLTELQAPPTGCSTSNGTTSSPSVERKEDNSSEERRPEYEEASEEYAQRLATIELHGINPIGIEEHSHDDYHDTVDSNDHLHSPNNINSAVQTTHF